MSKENFFDSDLVPEVWADHCARPESWFDDDLLVLSAAVAPDQRFDDDALWFADEADDEAWLSDTDYRNTVAVAVPADPPSQDGWDWTDGEVDDDSWRLDDAPQPITHPCPSDDWDFAAENLDDEAWSWWLDNAPLPLLALPCPDDWDWFADDISDDWIDNQQALVVAVAPNPPEDGWDWHEIADDDTVGLALAGDALHPEYLRLWPDLPLPALLNLNDGQTIETGTRFYSDVAGKIVGISFYKNSASTLAHTVTLWDDATQAILAQKTTVFANEVTAGWYNVIFDTPVDIIANKVYVVSVNAQDNIYAATNGVFVSQVNTGVLHSATGINGVFAFPAPTPSFPTSTFNNTSYWVDPLFIALPFPVQDDNQAFFLEADTDDELWWLEQPLAADAVVQTAQPSEPDWPWDEPEEDELWRYLENPPVFDDLSSPNYRDEWDWQEAADDDGWLLDAPQALAVPNALPQEDWPWLEEADLDDGWFADEYLLVDAPTPQATQNQNEWDWDELVDDDWANLLEATDVQLVDNTTPPPIIIPPPTDFGGGGAPYYPRPQQLFSEADREYHRKKLLSRRENKRLLRFLAQLERERDEELPLIITALYIYANRLYDIDN